MTELPPPPPLERFTYLQKTTKARKTRGMKGQLSRGPTLALARCSSSIPLQVTHMILTTLESRRRVVIPSNNCTTNEIKSRDVSLVPNPDTSMSIEVGLSDIVASPCIRIVKTIILALGIVTVRAMAPATPGLHGLTVSWTYVYKHPLLIL
jgi:hypothetical protein